MVTRVNVNLPAPLKARLIEEAAAQRRSHRALVEMALERYFAELDRSQARQRKQAQTPAP